MEKNNSFTLEQQKFLLSLARKALDFYFKTEKVLDIDEESIVEELRQERGTFVTLTKYDQLRGCIGHIEAVNPIYLDVIENVLSAAFADTRFKSLQKEELKDLEIEISILTEPKELKFNSSEDLLIKLQPNIHGVIIEKGEYGATYLPQVWEDVPGKEEFLSSLCLKAGLPLDEWQKPGMKVWVYEVEVIK